MTYRPMTPFRRACNAVRHPLDAHGPNSGTITPVDKWEVLNILSAVRERLGLSDRTLTVLQALLSFHPTRTLGDNGIQDLVVFPSNAAICARLNGMPCSTMRRHIAKLVENGLIERRDSPNGKRFVRRYTDSRDAFGFDLAPLPRRFDALQGMAREIQIESDRKDRLRRTLSLKLRDLVAMCEIGAHHAPAPLWDQLGDCAQLSARTLRRKLTIHDLTALQGTLDSALQDAQDALEVSQAEEPSTNAAQNEHHIQSSKKETIRIISEPSANQSGDIAKDPSVERLRKNQNHLPLELILSRCKEIQTYASAPVRNWQDFRNTVETVRPMMGISSDMWRSARTGMGDDHAAVTLAAMLERFAEIKNPGGYLNALVTKFRKGAFTYKPMIAALAP